MILYQSTKISSQASHTTLYIYNYISLMKALNKGNHFRIAGFCWKDGHQSVRRTFSMNFCTSNSRKLHSGKFGMITTLLIFLKFQVYKWIYQTYWNYRVSSTCIDGLISSIYCITLWCHQADKLTEAYAVLAIISWQFFLPFPSTNRPCL